jgi:RimJ/RimL family protein N-acetyltransferase
MVDKIIETKRLILRPFVIEDAQAVSNNCNNYNLAKTTLALPYPYAKDVAINWINRHEEWFEKDVRYEFAITLKGEGILIGAIGLGNNSESKNGEVGYWIGEEYWNNGYATEALKAIIKWAFEQKEFHRIYARHFEMNASSGKVMINAGMTYEGKQIDHIFKNGSFHNIVLYGIVNKRNYLE